MNTADTLQQVTEIARTTGNTLRDYFAHGVAQQTKATSVDIVTDADKAAEEIITRALLDAFPDTHLVGEEGGGSGASADRAAFFWYVDPIDGTTNFANRIPHFCTSIALTDAQQNPLLGVVYQPITDDLYTARLGEGAFLNGEPIRVSQKTELIQCVVASGFAYDKHKNPDNNLAQWGAMMMRTRGVRRMGSAALDMAYIAAGRFDAYWERSLHLWDVLAGVLLVREAGGRVTNYQGDERPQEDRDGKFAASNGHIHEAFLQVLQESYS